MLYSDAVEIVNLKYISQEKPMWPASFLFTLLQHGQTIADFLQRLVCKYGDESGSLLFSLYHLLIF